MSFEGLEMDARRVDLLVSTGETQGGRSVITRRNGMRLRRKMVTGLLVAMGVAWIGLAPTQASTFAPQNLADMVVESEDIVRGVVSNVTEGRHGNLPYTEVTVNVAEMIKGINRQELIFRQIGLQTPEEAQDGRVFLGLAAGMPRYTPGERVVLFLGRETEGGFRTTVGQTQGKFNMIAGGIENGIHNQGLFYRLPAAPGTRTASQATMLKTPEGRVSSYIFLDLVRQAVAERWWQDPIQNPKPVQPGHDSLNNNDLQGRKEFSNGN